MTEPGMVNRFGGGGAVGFKAGINALDSPQCTAGTITGGAAALHSEGRLEYRLSGG